MTTTFLTSLAPMASVRGSLDPLGLMAVWSRLGRRIVLNVSTVSGDLRGWTTLLLGTYVARSWIERGDRAEDDFTDLVLRFEQIVAYAREKHEADAQGVRGILGVRRRLAEHGPRAIPLGQGRDARILANQRATGVWGQIAGPAQNSKLLDARHLRLTTEAEERVRALYGHRLARHEALLRELLVDRRPLDRDGRHAPLMETLHALHAPTPTDGERAFYREHVLYASEDENAVQARLVRLWVACGHLRHPVDATEVAALAERADPELRDRLDEIRRVETLLAPAEHLFAFLLGRHGQRIEQVLADIGSRWTMGLGDIDPHAAELVEPYFRGVHGSRAPADAFDQLRRALATRAWGDAVGALIELNAWIADRRGGAAWLGIEEGRLEVRMQGEPGDLPTDAGHLLWTHSYYLEPLRTLSLFVEGADVA